MEYLINELRGQVYALMEDKKYRGRIIIKDEKEKEFTFCFSSTNGHFFTERRFYVDERDNAFGSYKLFCQAPWVGEAVIVDKLSQYRLKEGDTLLSILESDDEVFNGRDEEGSVNTIYYASYSIEQYTEDEGIFLRKMQYFLNRGKVLNKFILHFSIGGYTVWTVDQQGKPLKLQTKGKGLAEAETLIRDVMRLSGVTFDSKEVTERLLAPILGDKLNECSRNDFSFHNLNSELKDVDIDLSYLGGVIVVDITVDIRNEETVSVGREFPCPQNDAFLQALSLTNVVDYIKLMYQCIDGERIGDLDRENQYLSDIYQHLSEDIKETFDVKEPTVIYPEQSIKGETYPYLPFGKGVGLTIRKYEYGYYLDIATPTEPLLYLGIKYEPSKEKTVAFINEVVSLMSLVHAIRLKALAEELDVGLRIGEDIVEYSNDKAIEVRITLGKCQLKLEGVLFMKAATISVERAFIPNNTLEGIIRDFVSYCRGIDSHIECYKKD